MQNRTQPNYGFDEFRLDVPRRQLLRDGEVIQLNPKAFDMLVVLVENAGQVLTKDDLFGRVWHDQIVEESNLTVHISALRRALGENAKQPRFITTVTGEGYCFVGIVRALTDNDQQFVVESHTVGRIVVEQEENDDKGIFLPASGRQRRTRQTVAVICGVLLAGTVGVGGYFLIRNYQARSNTSLAAASIKKLTNDGRASYAALSPDNKLFAFATHDGKTSALWLGYIDGGQPIQIRPSAEMIYLSVKFSPDGSSLYYVSSENFRHGDLYRIPVFGGAPEKLRDNVRGTITFAPDGKRLAFVRSDPNSGQQSLMVTDLNGGNEEKIAEPPANFGFIAGTVVWSPNSEMIAVGAGNDDDHLTSQILIADAANKTISALPTEGWNTINGLTWLHDGSGLIVAAREKDALANQLWHVSYPSGEKRRVVTDLNNYGGSISLSADDKNLLAVQVEVESNIWAAPADDLSKAKQITFGSPGQNNGWNGLEWVGGGQIVYSKQVNNSISIWSSDADGSSQKQLIPGGGSSITPSVPDDQKYVVFQSDRGGNPAIWRADIDGGNLVQLTGAGIAAQPRVSPDGKWIFYVGDLGDVGDLWRMTIDGGDQKRLSDTEFSWVGVSPDSKLLAGGYIENGKPKLGIMSIDGGDLLKSFDVPRLANFRLGIHWTSDGQAVTYRDWANGIWKQSIGGGEPELIKDLPEEKLYGYGWSPDGKRFAYTRGAEIVDVVWISGSNQF